MENQQKLLGFYQQFKQMQPVFLIMKKTFTYQRPLEGWKCGKQLGGQKHYCYYVQEEFESLLEQSVMLLFLLQDKLVLVAQSTPEKITLPATLGKVSPVKAQPDHTVFLYLFQLRTFQSFRQSRLQILSCEGRPSSLRFSLGSENGLYCS